MVTNVGSDEFVFYLDRPLHSDLEQEKKVLNSKDLEIKKGVDGFLIFDLGFLKGLNQLDWSKQGTCPQTDLEQDDDLLGIPQGIVTQEGLLKNIKVGRHWKIFYQ
jgi:hypothetical protein